MFYTYLHRRNDTGQVFYVGKGKGNRAYVTSKRSDHWKCCAAKHGHTVEICAHWSSEADAFTHEIFLIRLFRDLGSPLVNATDGGEGTAGINPSSTTRAKISVAATAQFAKPGAKEARSALIRAQWADPEIRAKRIAGIRKTSMTPENKAKRVAACKAVWASPEAKARRSLVSLDVWGRPGHKAQHCKHTLCIETGVVYSSTVEAALAHGLRPGNITNVCLGANKRAGGFTFRYLNLLEDSLTTQL